MSLQSLAYMPLEAQPIATLSGKLSHMTALSQLRLHYIILDQDLSSIQCLSLLELTLVSCKPDDIPSGLHTAFPSLERLHIEGDRYVGRESERTGGEYQRKMIEKSHILYSLPRLRQLSGNTIVRSLAEQNLLSGWRVASSAEGVKSYALDYLHKPEVVVWRR